FSQPNGHEGHLQSVKQGDVGSYRDVREIFLGNDGVVETGRWYFKHFGTGARREAPNADDLRDRSLIERVNSKREITIDAVEAFYQAILASKSVNMTKDATESTLSCLPRPHGIRNQARGHVGRITGIGAVNLLISANGSKADLLKAIETVDLDRRRMCCALRRNSEDRELFLRAPM